MASAAVVTASVRNLHNSTKRAESREVGEISMWTMLISPSVQGARGVWRVAQVPWPAAPASFAVRTL